MRPTIQRKPVLACVAVELMGLLCGMSGVGILFAGSPLLGILSMLAYWSFLCVGVVGLSEGYWWLLIPLPLWWVGSMACAGLRGWLYNQRLRLR